MGVMVYSRLGEALRAHHLTVDDLQHQIATRFGSAVDARTLGRLARDGRVRRPNIEIVAAAATALGVGLAMSSASTPNPPATRARPARRHPSTGRITSSRRSRADASRISSTCAADVP